jgi:hypothetical protein
MFVKTVSRLSYPTYPRLSSSGSVHPSQGTWAKAEPWEALRRAEIAVRRPIVVSVSPAALTANARAGLNVRLFERSTGRLRTKLEPDR